MNASQNTWRQWASSPSVVFYSLLIGVALGLYAPGLAKDIGVFGDIYVDLLKMIILPFMVSAVIFSLRKLMMEGGTSRMLGRIVLIFVLAMFGTALLGLVTALVIAPGADLPADTLLTLGKLVGEDIDRSGHIEMALFSQPVETKPPGFASMLLSIIPNNIFAALSHGDTLKAMVFSLLFGLAIGRLPAGASQSLTQTLETIYQACQTLTHWFNYMLPVVLISMVGSQVAKTGLEPLRAMLHFIVTLGIASLLLIIVSLWALCWTSGLPWRQVLRSQREPLTMAIATRSSPACMPAMIESLADHLAFPRARIELLVPLGVSLLRLGPILYYMLAALFIAQMYGRSLSAGEMAIISLGSVLAGFASAGMSGLVTLSLTGVVCRYIGLPFEAILVLFVAIDPICDMFRTAVLVAGNNAFAALACGRSKPQ